VFSLLRHDNHARNFPRHVCLILSMPMPISPCRGFRVLRFYRDASEFSVVPSRASESVSVHPDSVEKSPHRDIKADFSNSI
jgi:hypothetical protein